RMLQYSSCGRRPGSMRHSSLCSRSSPSAKASACQEEALMIRVTVLYPNEAGKKFDVSYYTTKHMKLVAERLKSFGVVRTEVDKGVAGGAPGSPAPDPCIGHVY